MSVWVSLDSRTRAVNTSVFLCVCMHVCSPNRNRVFLQQLSNSHLAPHIGAHSPSVHPQTKMCVDVYGKDEYDD